ncbi:MAG: hypothetical protein QNJ53_15650 [Pleurocapsa sp. MO_192.B19]|nr:hypothetical protein [Pleurocapsa sp. MO_192.B19]
MEKGNRAQALTERAQRKLQEVNLDFGSQFASYYRRRINVLCKEIFQSLEQNDELSLDKAEADLQDNLFELDREVRLQYDDEEGNNFIIIDHK